jgi:S1-C subfamily serine protease
VKKIMLLFLCCFSLSTSCHELSKRISSAKPSIVAIAILNPTASPRLSLIGTGFAVGDGHQIATNAHVIAKLLDESKNERYVVLSGQGANPKIHFVLKQKVDAKYDLAVLQINDRIEPLTLAADEYQPEGSELLFTGYPITEVLGLYPASNKAMISAVTPVVIPANHASELSPQVLRQLQQPFLIYQLDGTAYPGNSGSPVYSVVDGTVVAVINMVYVKQTKESVLSNPSGISYAIPSRHLRALLARPFEG